MVKRRKYYEVLFLASYDVKKRLYRSPSALVQAFFFSVLFFLIKFFVNRLHGISQQAVSGGFTVDLC